MAVASSITRNPTRMTTVVGALCFVTDWLIRHDRKGGMAVFEDVGKIPIFPAMVGGYEKVNVAQMLAKRPVLQQSFPARLLQIAGEDYADVTIVKECNKTEVVGVIEIRIGVMECRDPGTGKVGTDWLRDAAHAAQQCRNAGPQTGALAQLQMP